MTILKRIIEAFTPAIPSGESDARRIRLRLMEEEKEKGNRITREIYDEIYSKHPNPPTKKR